VDFEQLRTFLEVSRLRSFSRAAEKLSVTQPAISAQIRSLETEVGARLFDRDGGKVTFTAAGRVFEPFAEHALECQAHIGVTIAELHRSPRGEISISANEATSLYVLPQVFAAFKKQYTRVGLKIVRADRARILEDVLNREVDFGVVSLPVKDARLIVERIHKDEVVLVAGPSHPLAQTEKIALAELLQYPLLLTKSGRQREQIDDFFRGQDVQPRVAMEVESSEAADCGGDGHGIFAARRGCCGGGSGYTAGHPGAGPADFAGTCSDLPQREDALARGARLSRDRHRAEPGGPVGPTTVCARGRACRVASPGIRYLR
jgi:DNA-binding transcriptional LysR family regulator